MDAARLSFQRMDARSWPSASVWKVTSDAGLPQAALERDGMIPNCLCQRPEWPEAVMNRGQSIGFAEHGYSRSDDVHVDNGFGQLLVIASQPAIAHPPGDEAVHEPTPGQQHEAMLGLR